MTAVQGEWAGTSPLAAPRPRIAVLGLYNSGSTTLAGMLHRLGANLGPPFWTDSDDESPGNYYESHDLTWHLRLWWDEPHLVERLSAPQREGAFKAWIAWQEAMSPSPAALKHPLLALCLPELLRAWGPGTRLVWAWRPLQDSIDGLLRRRWYSGHEQAMQEALWAALEEANASGLAMERMAFDEVRAAPRVAAEQLARLAGLAPSEHQLARAVAFVRAG